ncbi:MAG: PQQ-dependent sugar dehydrogenase [Solirubrobacteraceae bacterium]
MNSRVAAALLVVGVALAACGSDGGADAAGSTASSSGSAAESDGGGGGGTSTGSAAQARRGVRLVRIGGFDTPVYVTQPPGDNRRLMVVEQTGRVMVVRGGRKLGTPFLDIRSQVTYGGEQGLLSVAFPPDYQSSGRFYVYFTSGSTNRIVEFRRASADRANASSARVVLSMPNLEPNHNGGLMVFGPDGLMYVGTGDGGGANDQHGAAGNAQNLGSLLGKLLRIDPAASSGRPYSIPSSNPFVNRAGARGEIYSYGLRNPWRFSFDRSTGAITIGDVGQGAIEEIDHEPRDGAAGVNFGWSAFEGRSRYNGGSAPDAVPPVIQHTHADGWCSIVGGYVMRDASVPALLGRYVYGDLCQPRVYAARLRSHFASDRRLGLTVPELVSFGEDAAGNVYAVSLSGPVYRIDAG